MTQTTQVQEGKHNLAEEKIALPQGITAKYESHHLAVKGPKGEVVRKLLAPNIKVTVGTDALSLSFEKKSKRAKKTAGSFKAHLKNIIKGVTEGHLYKMKICSGHFPMTVTVQGTDLTIKNFFGEKNPRKLKIAKDVKVKVDGVEIAIESANKESAAQCAASIEQITRRTNFDKRIFMDGIYIINKDGKDVSK